MGRRARRSGRQRAGICRDAGALSRSPLGRDGRQHMQVLAEDPRPDIRGFPAWGRVLEGKASRSAGALGKGAQDKGGLPARESGAQESRCGPGGLGAFQLPSTRARLARCGLPLRSSGGDLAVRHYLSCRHYFAAQSAGGLASAARYRSKEARKEGFRPEKSLDKKGLLPYHSRCKVEGLMMRKGTLNEPLVFCGLCRFLDGRVGLGLRAIHTGSWDSEG